MIERFIVDDAGTLIDIHTGEHYDYFEEVVDLMNKQETDKLNYKRQLNTLKHTLKRLSE